MKAAGQPGTLDILRAWAYLHLLSGKPAATLIPTTGTPATGTPGDGTPAGGTPGDGTHATGTSGDGMPGAAGSEPPRSRGPQQVPGAPDAGPHFPAASGAGAPGGPVTAGLRGTVNLTMPLSAWLGWTQSPGDVPGFGPIDAEDSRTLADLLAHRPANQWCVTLTDPAGHPVAHACARHGPPGSRPPVGPDPEPETAPEPTSGPAPPSGPAGTALGPGPPTTPVPDWLGGLTFATLETADCTHPRQSRGYQPSPSLRHLVQVRNPSCTGPGCRRPANRCDLDHVTPYDQGGKTCECNLHPASKS